MDKKKMLANIKKEICDIYPSAKIILYGSRARGDFNKYSDWDLLILLNENINFAQKLAINYRLFKIELEVNEVLIPIIHNVKEWDDLETTPFYQNVQREGIKL